MKLRKVMALTLAGAMTAATLTACGGGADETTAAAAGADKETTAAAEDKETTAAAADSGSADAEVVLQVAFENSITEPVGEGWTKAQEIIKEKSGGKMAIEVYPDSQLGDKSSLIDSMLLGENVCTLADGAFYADYGVPDFGIVFGPFLFDSWDQVWKLVDSDWYKEQCDKLEEKGLKIIASNWIYGERHTLTNVPVNTVDDLKGLKIRVQDMKSQTDMMKALGGIPVAMSYGDVYTSLQTGIIDGTENNETALTTGKHGEICKVYSTDQHAMIPDVMVMSEKVWKNISPEDQQIILEAARESTEQHKIAWDAAIDQAIEEAKTTMGVEFVNDVDKEAFREATSGMISDYCEQYPGVKKLLDIIDSVE